MVLWKRWRVSGLCRLDCSGSLEGSWGGQSVLTHGGPKGIETEREQSMDKSRSVYPSDVRLRSLASMLARHHFQSVASLLNLLPDVVVMRVESCLVLGP